MERGLTGEEVERLSRGDVKASSISRWETGERSIRPGDVRVLLEVYEISGDQAATLLTLARQAKERGWWQPFTPVLAESFNMYVGLEAEASVIREYASELVPGLLQTEGYYRAFLDVAPAEPNADRKVEARMTRQERLTGDDRPRYWAVLNEAVIRRTVGGARVMREQLAHLAELAQLPDVTIQVLPFSAGAHPAMEGPFSILGFPEPLDPDVAYLENRGGSVYVEEAEEIDRYSQMFTHLIAKALSAEDSADLIGEAADALSRGR